MRIKRIDPELNRLLDRMASAWQTTRRDAYIALIEADEIVVIDGTARLIKPTQPDGRIEG